MRSIKHLAVHSITLLAAFVALSGALAGAAQAEPGTHSKLTPVGGGSGGGAIGISPTAHDVVGADTFDGQGTVNVHGLAPDTGYKILRWVDLNPDGVCTGTTALSLPGDPTLTTSNGGAGALHFQISRGAPFVDGVRYDVIARVVDLAGNTVLQSDCLTSRVK
ncbi:hypothetical protein SAMN05192558_101487 [Actinokineospora alba]|uniref:Uncharacterized protein n=1 Tax=Actinokineospora alba TaxID=504798 RepID=A0A1H0FSC9_9PSEU|nr:hypothetical protein [Actinokineospora alba]TDP69592.1 hypothetical protein C8E96_5183 [Actinokineospora alba]SDI13454.1 hypothetical protein SAMN05421871_103384 [Actinokineospora alba]SDN97451.1 hypothetical protein SAMN05192558_101487 [Actinokineospora alba]